LVIHSFAEKRYNFRGHKQRYSPPPREVAKERRQKMKISPTHSDEAREGDVYAVVTVFDKTFELKYGYYDDKDRSGPPDVIYPDFIHHPIYIQSGEPIVTMMQDACQHYRGNIKRADDATCGECKHFCRAKEWFGVCRLPKKQKGK
jgi:hypothetical protein